jgi:hypothetical protein
MRTTLSQIKIFRDLRFIEDIEKPMNDWLDSISEKISSFEITDIKVVGDNALAILYTIDPSQKNLLEE